jgi:MYXO-CTERM domain-containing protein
VGSNRLQAISENGNTITPQFTPPLGSGTYTMLLQDTASNFNYQFTFNVSAVPEPATLGLAAVGLLAIGRLARRR